MRGVLDARSGLRMPGFEMQRREVDVFIRGAQVFIPPGRYVEYSHWPVIVIATLYSFYVPYRLIVGPQETAQHLLLELLNLRQKHNIIFNHPNLPVQLSMLCFCCCNVSLFIYWCQSAGYPDVNFAVATGAPLSHFAKPSSAFSAYGTEGTNSTSSSSSSSSNTGGGLDGDNGGGGSGSGSGSGAGAGAANGSGRRMRCLSLEWMQIRPEVSQKKKKKKKTFV